MKRFILNISLLLFAATSLAKSPESFDWPQWQGSGRNAMSKETGLLKEWPKEGPSLAWKVTGLGGGDSTPSVAAGRIYGMSTRGTEEMVWALSEKDGKEIWAVPSSPAQPQSWPQSKEGPACTPTVDGDRLYVIGLAGVLSCLQVSDGKMLWQRNLKADFGGKSPMWSYRESPLIDGDRVVCTPGGVESTMVALNKLTGELIWKSSIPDRAAAATAPGRGPAPSPPSAMRMDPFLSKLDANQDNAISPEELAASPAALLTFDKNQDGILSQDELSPPASARSGQDNSQRRRRGPGIMRMMKAHSALDADESDALEASEIKDAAQTLKKLDANSDGKLTDDEAGFKQMGPENTSAGYSSAIAVDFEGQRQYVQFLARTVVGVAANDGRLLWRYDKPANSMGITISTPIFHDGQVFAASAYGAGGGLAKLIKNPGGGYAAQEVWFSKSMENHHGGVILLDGALYGSNGGNGGGYLACLDLKTGDILWNERDNDKKRASKGSVAYADGRIYYRTEEGAILLIEPSRKEYLERGRFEQPERTKLPAWAHPVIANGKLYIRDQDTLFCYDVKSKTE